MAGYEEIEGAKAPIKAWIRRSSSLGAWAAADFLLPEPAGSEPACGVLNAFVPTEMIGSTNLI